VLIAEGEREAMERAIALIESIKGEPAVAPLKGECSECRYACRFAGMPEEELPVWLQRAPGEAC